MAPEACTLILRRFPWLLLQSWFKIHILGRFFKTSGLKINLSKTKAIWFGAGSHFSHHLCPDIPLEWDSEFTLLGIKFDSSLMQMDRNYDYKLQEVKKLLNCWIYRSITPYGKIVIIKSLALSKLSHTAMLIPTLKKMKFKK